MKTYHRCALRSSIAAIGLMVLAGCSTGGQKLTRSGFLSDYTQLQKPSRDVAVWVAPGYQASSYRQAIIDEVLWLAPPRDAKTERMLRDSLRQRIVDAMPKQYRVVSAEEASPGTLRVRSAITGVRRSRWFLNVPIQAATMAAGGLGVLGPLRGGGSVEMQVEDASTRQPMIQLATYRNGRPWDIKGSYVAYDHARQAFGDAAGHLAEYVDGTKVPPVLPAETTARRP